MRSKKLLTLLLVICMVISCIAPAALAVSPAENAAVSATDAAQKSQLLRRNETAAAAGDANVVTGSEASRDITADAPETAPAEPTVNAAMEAGEDGDGQWSFTEIDEADVPETVSGLLSENGTTDCVAELDALEDVYDASQVVTVFVVLEDEPLAATYGSAAQVPENVAQAYAQKQQSVYDSILETVDSSAEVVRQFSFLTNSLVLSTEFQNLKTIAQMDGVASVFVSPTFYPATTATDADKMTVSSGQMTNVDDVWNLNNSGYTGAGMVIAILDTGLDVDHPSFAADPKLTDDSWTKESLQAKNLTALNAYKRNSSLTADYLYYSAKVPFTFNYALGTNNVTHNDAIGDHGTHVAGISAANAVEGTGVVGMAPDAQLVIMKVFNSTTGGASLYDFVDALEDCITLGVDAANLSLGSAAGFSESGYEEVDAIFDRIEKSGLIVNIAAGNEGTSASGSLYGSGKALTSSIDNATVASPSTYANVMSIASVDNAYVMADYFSVGEEKVFYQPSVEALYGYTNITLAETLSGQTLEYVILDGLGEEADFYDADGNSLVSGKVAVIKRGSLTFSAKVANAEAAGAVAALIWNNQSEDIYTFGMTTANEADGSYPGIPAVLIRLEDGEMMAAAESKTMTITGDAALRINATGGQVSSFSSWGVSADLRLLPDLSGIGGNVYSCYDGGAYGLMSGTSMATPQVTGVTALVQQYLKSIGAYDRALVEKLMMSTANVIIDSESEVETSPRQQGAGLVDALKAVTAEAYLTVNGGRPKAELGASTDGSYSFTFTVHNMSDEAKEYTLSSSLLCEDFVSDGSYEYMAGYDRALSGTVTFSESTVTVPAKGTKNVTVSIALSDADKTWINEHFANGNYVEGYVYLTNTAESGVGLNLPFLGFYGQWTKAPVFDQGFWYSESFWSASAEGVKPAKDAEEYYHVLWTSMGSTTNDWMLGLNPYSGVLADEDGKVFYSSSNNVLNPDGDGVMDQISDYYLSLLRNARYVKLTYTDESGNVLSEQTLEYLNKTMYNSNAGSTVPYVYSWYETTPLYDFKDADGNYLADGTKVTLTISASIDYHDGEYVADDALTIPITIDLTKPRMTSVQESTYDGNRYLVVTLDEAHPATVALMNPAGTQIYDQVYDNTLVKNEDGTYTAMLDITGHGDDFMVVLGDYGYQETHYQVSRTTPGGNDPVLENGLYAYQVYDLGIHYYYGWDYMFGWTEIDPTNGTATMINSDAYEYYAINAAEYVDGYVFAVDAGDNFLYMKPGLWNRTIIRNIGYNVIDMAFDDVTDTMYLIISDEGENFYGLATLDLMTGEVMTLRNYYGKYSMPWAMTFVDGELYCCKNYYAGFYQVDLENNYEVIPVYTADGAQFQPTTASGQTTSPCYGQSMTCKDGKIYWLYCSSSTTTELICIDPETWTNTAIALGSTEYVGALTLDETDYQIPESSAITDLVLSQNEALIAEGETLTLTASYLPWNAPAADITWTSDDNSVVTVTDGVITGIAAGSATVTATCGETITATCTVRVISVGSDVYAYDYSGDGTYGYWQTIELSTMTATNGDYSDVEFLAADYNGHDGYIYGIDSNEGCAWKVDPSNQHKAEKLGYAGFVADMAYDYSTGIMYVINGQDQYLYAMNLHSGKLVKVANLYDTLGVLSCDLDGNLFGISSLSGALLMLNVREGTGDEGGDEGGDGGIAPLGGWSALYAALDKQDLDDDIGVDPGFGNEGEAGASMVADVSWLGNVDVSTYDGLYYGQCMCYDYNNDVLLWCYTDGEIFRQIGLTTDESGMPALDYVYDLGKPSGHTLPQYFGMYVAYDGTYPELNDVYVSSITAEDIFLLVGGSATVDVDVSPVNVNQPYEVYCEVGFSQNENGQDDWNVLTIAEDGTITANKAGTAYVDVYAVDNLDAAEPVLYGQTTIKVTVKNATNSDIRTFFGDNYCWVDLNQHDVSTPEFGSYVMYNGSYHFMYSAEYCNETGLIYGYGFDINAWDANFIFFTFDPQSMSIRSAVDMGNEFPFVYDLAYDYTTGTMYALGGTTDVVSLYYVDLATGKLIQACTLDDTMYLSMAVDKDGTVYLMSKTAYSYVDYEEVQLPAILSTVDVKTGEITEVFNTGVYSSYVSSLSYDYDTGYFYWTPYMGMYLIDLNDMSINKMGSTSAQYTGLLLLSDKDAYPKAPTDLVGVVMASSSVEMDEGETAQLSFFTQPSNVDVTTSWKSEDESIATVDENGVVTGVSAGTTTVTVTVTDSNDNTVTASCTVIVYGEGDYFLSYNVTDRGFSSINRMDPSRVTNLTEGEEEAAVNAMVAVDNVIYAYDEEGNFFSTTVESGFQRNYLGSHGIDVSDSSFEDYDDWGGGTIQYNHYNAALIVEDMTVYDGKVLALGVTAFHVTSDVYYDNVLDYSYEWYTEMYGGCRLYEVNLEDGTLTELCTVLAEDGDNMSHTKMLEEANGSLYIYSASNDHINIVNPEDGTSSLVASMQNLGVYGEETCLMSMTYDESTNSMTMLFTSNGEHYRLFKMNLATASINEIGNVGEVSNGVGDLFHGLTSVSVELSGDEHEHSWDEVDYKAPTCVENGYRRYRCSCGETFEKVLPSTGKHEYAYNTKGELVCVHCGKVQSTTLPSIPTTPNTPASLPFTDVTKNDWFYSAVSYVYNKGLMNGTSDTLFDPNGSVTRAMVVQTLYRLAGSPRVSGTNSFSDLTQDWYQNAVQWAYENGITTGRSDTIFDPNASVTREELAAFMYRYAVYCGYSVKASADLTGYTDLSSLSTWAETSMGWANAEGIVNGRTAATLAPQGTATRAELATILMRFCENIVG